VSDASAHHAERYTHGHHDSVLRSHRWRTAANSCGYLLPHLRPTFRILDIGCGPGTITTDLAAIVPDGHVTGLDRTEIVDQARRHAATAGVADIRPVAVKCKHCGEMLPAS